MKLCLNVEADSISVLALNPGIIAVEVDGIELTELIDVVCDNGYSLRVADEPGMMLIEDLLSARSRYNGILCSTAHITSKDNDILFQLSRQRQSHEDAEWIHYTGSGYLIRLDAWIFPAL